MGGLVLSCVASLGSCLAPAASSTCSGIVGAVCGSGGSSFFSLCSASPFIKGVGHVGDGVVGVVGEVSSAVSALGVCDVVGVDTTGSPSLSLLVSEGCSSDGEVVVVVVAGVSIGVGVVVVV